MPHEGFGDGELILAAPGHEVAEGTEVAVLEVDEVVEFGVAVVLARAVLGVYVAACEVGLADVFEEADDVGVLLDGFEILDFALSLLAGVDDFADCLLTGLGVLHHADAAVVDSAAEVSYEGVVVC